MEKNYSRHYNEKSLQEKLKNFSVKAGQQVVYVVLLLYYLMKDPKTGMKKKLTIAAALGYFILPTDFIPDLVPVIGFSDDLGVLVFALVQISSSITPEIKRKAREKMNEWFKQLDDKELLAIDEKINGEE